ncbi:hypothetical protein SKAU_G00346900 [Synaphobranchus kaupii]|uniref:Fibronectin type-III domain-containing protein n=1 Tax=Synaphobranchus kaupii TaxID=118154 RepID=A0A9Q1EJQ5_SYNKA|nr:hypothetical protein SKAU_G00346900 [Synaphobranchus kaupii]
MRRPQSTEGVSLKTVLVMLVFLKVSREVSGCTNDVLKIGNISTSEITILGASNCTDLNSSTPVGNDLIVRDLQPGTSYNLTVNCSHEYCIQFTTRPDVIRNLSVTLITTTSVSLNWTEPQGNSSFYRVEWDEGAVPMNKTTNRTSVDITGLTAGVQYVFSVVAVAADSETAGDPVSKTQYTRPDVIRNLSVTQISTTSVSLSWAEPQGNSLFYKVDWDVGTVPMTKTTNRTSVDITGLTAGVQYVFSVVAVAADSHTAGDSVNKTQYTRPDVIRNLSVTQITTTSVSLNWTEPQGNSSFYRVEWYEGTVPMDKTTNRTSVDITGLTAGVQYVFSVVAVAADSQIAGNSVNKTQYTRPDVIRNLSVTQITTTSVSLNWTEPQGNSSFYRVEWYEGTVPMDKTTNRTSVDITGLTAGVQYVFSVVAVAADSQIAGNSVNKTQYTRPDVIRNLSVTQISTTSVSLSWAEPQGNSSFYRVDWDVGTVPMTKTTNRTSVDITGLTAGVQYVFSVVAVAADSETTGDSVNKTQYTRPDVIRNLSVTQITTTSVSLSWTVPQGNNSFYNVEWDVDTVPMNKTTNRTSVDITGLTAGVQYVFSVVAVAADSETAGDSVNKRQYTRPDVIRKLSVTQISTTSVSLRWAEPQGNSLFYRVDWDVGTVPMTKTTNRTSVDITGLTAGVQYVFSVVAVAADSETTGDSVNKTQYTNSQTAGDSVNKTQYTRPEKAVNVTQTRQTNHSLDVAWSLQGNATSYELYWTEPRDNVHIIVTAVAGPFKSTSDTFPFATNPNPPEAIKVQEQTTSSIKISWDGPLDMDPGQYNFTVLLSDLQLVTAHNWALVGNRTSGTQYNISVATVGPLDTRACQSRYKPPPDP